MSSPVNSKALRAVYVVLGGLPALYLCVLAFAFKRQLWAIGYPEHRNYEDSMLLVIVFCAWCVGTISGFLAFIGIGTGTSNGRCIYTICIGIGICAAVAFAWWALQRGELPSFVALLPIIPSMVGGCLLYHVWRAA